MENDAWVLSPDQGWIPSDEDEVKSALDGAWDLDEIFTVVLGKPESKRPALGDSPRGSIIYDMQRRRMVVFLSKTLPYFAEPSFLNVNEVCFSKMKDEKL